MGYHKLQIENREIKDTASRLAAHQLISKVQLAGIFMNFPDQLYVPGFFVRLGLFIFTLILVNSGLGIFFLLFTGLLSDAATTGGMMIIYSGLVFWALEMFTGKRFHFRSGIDDCLLYSGISFLVSGLVLTPSLFEPVQICLVALPILILAAWRYADSFVALSAFVCFYVLLFLLLRDYSWSRTAMPFIFLALSAALLAVFNRQLSNDRLDYYDYCFKILKVAALCTLYASVNYFVVREGNMFLNDIPEDVFINSGDVPEFYEIPLPFLFIAFTVLIPIVYIFLGLRNRDRLLLWTGMGVMALSVLTIRYRFHIMSYEYALTLGGILLVTGCWWAISKLKHSPGQYNFIPDPSGHHTGLLNAEAMVIAQTLVQPVKEQPEGFGGGSFGGGGAGGTV